MTEAEMMAMARHADFNEWLKIERDIKQMAGTARPDDNRMPRELEDHQRSQKMLAGFSMVLVIKDRRGRAAYVAATQDGHFWPMVPGPQAGMGAKARNEWGAKELAKRWAMQLYKNEKMLEGE